MALVEGTRWHEVLELNRMAFNEYLPKNSESRCIAISLRLIKKNAPHIKWVLSFADGTQCGDGAIYRAAGFVLTAIKRNNSIIRLPDGRVSVNIVFTKSHHVLKNSGKAAIPEGSVALPGFQLRYVHLLWPGLRLTIPAIPFSEIEAQGARMYKGKKLGPTGEGEA